MGPVTNEEFVGYLRSALHNLYDPVHLRRSPLVKLLRLPVDVETAATLQHVLTEAILALKPAEDEPPQSNTWRIYDTLNFQYFRQYPRQRLATQLGISERQLRREQRLALETLAQYVWKHHFTLTRTVPLAPVEALAERPGRRQAAAALDAELGWLKDPLLDQRSQLEDVLNTVHDLAQPLAQQWQTPLRLSIAPGAADFPVTQLVVRNFLLTILSVALPHSGGAPVNIAATRQGRTLEIVVSGADPQSRSEPFSDKQNASIDTARQLAAYDGAQFDIKRGYGELTVVLTLSAPDQIPVLVVDDNTDWLDLLRRYAAGSRYDIAGTREPGAAHGLAAKLQPGAIFLDVMMPNIDGWQIISELRNDQSTAHIPIVVCSILPLDAVALSLGVNAFMQKPITQQQFITMLDKLVTVPA
jgi:CheY-like chemotaxis protein